MVSLPRGVIEAVMRPLVRVAGAGGVGALLVVVVVVVIVVVLLDEGMVMVGGGVAEGVGSRAQGSWEMAERGVARTRSALGPHGSIWTVSLS